MGRKKEFVPEFCPHCHELHWLNQKQCPKCKEKMFKETPEDEELAIYSRVAHSNNSRGFHKLQNGLCWVVIGLIIALVGGLFIFLSLKKEANVVQGIDFAKPQWYVCVTFLSIGGVMLLVGTVISLLSINIRIKARRDIGYISGIRKAFRERERKEYEEEVKEE